MTLTVMGARALFVEKNSPMVSLPENDSLDPLSVCPFLQNFSFSASRKCTLLYLLAVFDLVLEEAFEEMRKHQSQFGSRVTSMMNYLAGGWV